jgi:hypothetical protein
MSLMSSHLLARRSAPVPRGVLWLGVGVAVAGLGYAAARAVRARRHRRAESAGATCHDYSDRVGFPKSPDEMRGAARTDFQAPEDMRTPDALAAYSGA